MTKVTGESEEDMQCHCSILHNSISLSTSSRIQLRFLVEGMRPDQVITIITITNINMIPVIMVIATIAKILILPHQDFNDFSMRGSFRFVNTLCTDSTLTRCLLLIFPLEIYIKKYHDDGDIQFEELSYRSQF